MKKILSIFIVLSFLIAEINEFEAVFNKQLQKQFVRALEENGFVDLGGNEFYIDGPETVNFKFSEIKAVQGGVGLFDLDVSTQGRHERGHIKIDLIKISIPISQFIDNLEQLQNGEMIEEINSFSIILEGLNFELEEKARDRWIEDEDYYDENWNDKYDRGEEFFDSNGNGKWDEGYWEENKNSYFDLEYELDELIFSFKGQLTKEIFENLEYGILPRNNQVVELSFGGMRYNSLTIGGINVFDLYASTGDISNIFSVDNFKIKFGFLPENNKLRFLVNSTAPVGSMNCEIYSDVQFNYNDFELSNFGAIQGSLSGDFNYPYDTSLDLDQYMEFIGNFYGLNNIGYKWGELILPNNSSATASLYSADLLNFMISLENGPPNPYLLKDLLSSLRFNYDISMSKFGYDFMDTTLPQELNVSFDEFIFKNFRFNVGLNNGSLSLDVDAPTNIFDFNFKSNVDLMSMFPYNMYDESDMRPPFINNATISVSNIHSDLEQYIREVEYNIGEQFPRQYGNIVLNISGTLDNPSIQGMNFPNQQPQQRY